MWRKLPETRAAFAAFTAMLLLLAGCGGEAVFVTATPVPSDTPTATFTASPVPSPTVTRTPLPSVTPTDPANPPTQPAVATANAAAVEEAPPPPLTIDLPVGWNALYWLVPTRIGLSGQASVPIAIYSGPVPEQPQTTGTIVVVWAFPSFSGALDSPEPNLWADGLRFLRGLLLDTSCNVGTDLEGRTTYRIGEREDAVGTYFQAVDCLGEPDTAGWFAGLNVEGLNYVFYIYTEPLSGIDAARGPLQTILNSVTWQELATATPDAAEGGE